MRTVNGGGTGMSMLKEADFYYGAVLSLLINKGICPALIEGGKVRQIYKLTTDQKDFLLFLKYRSKPIDTKTPNYKSWQFSFSDDDIKELTQFMSSAKHLSVGLVCGNEKLSTSEYAVINRDELEQLFRQSKTTLTISRKKGEKAFRIIIGGSREKAIQIPSNRLY